MDENFVAKSQELYTLLKNDGIKPPYNYYYNAVYSAPHVRFDRKQEVWDVLELI